MERMKRRWKYFSMEEIIEIAENAVPETYLDHWPISESIFEYSDLLVDKELSFIFQDGLKLDYCFLEKHKLLWAEQGGRSHENFYRAMAGPGHEEIVVVSHYKDGSTLPEFVNIFIDFETNLVTAIISKVGVPENPREVHNTIHFGQIVGEVVDPQAFKHDYTTDLVGKAISWTMPFNKKRRPIKHIYSTQLYYTYVTEREKGKFFVASNPADYIKLKEHLYIVSVIEERQSGCNLVYLINTETLKDVVTKFGIVDDEVDRPDRVVCIMSANREGTYSTMDTILG